MRPLLPPQDSPLGVHIFRHDLQTGVRVKGRDAIQLVAPRGETRWREALLTVQTKMSRAGCRRLLELPFDDPRVAAAVAATPRPLTSAAYAAQPLAECTSAQRAKLLTSLCRPQPCAPEGGTPPHPGCDPVHRATAAHVSRDARRAGAGRAQASLSQARSSSRRPHSPGSAAPALQPRLACAGVSTCSGCTPMRGSTTPRPPSRRGGAASPSLPSSGRRAHASMHSCTRTCARARTHTRTRTRTHAHAHAHTTHARTHTRTHEAHLHVRSATTCVWRARARS